MDAPQFLKDGQEVSVLFNTETELPMSVELPDKIVLLVTYTEPGLRRGDTATRTLKPATVETGGTVKRTFVCQRRRINPCEYKDR